MTRGLALLSLALLAACELKPDAAPGVGAPCEVGIGACRASGVLVTAASGGARCDAQTKPPGDKEICDLGMADENCNGIVNEGCNCVEGLSPAMPCGSNRGECRAGWQRCVDGRYASTCEGGVAPSAETCDGRDNDCNGVVDDVEGGCPGTSCPAATLAPTLSDPPERSKDVPPCAPGTCVLDRGMMAMTFCVGPGSWTQCKFNRADVDVFDADHGAAGVIEVEFCLNARISGVYLSLYYGKHPYRKGLPLVSDVERALGLGPGCYRRYFSPEDAQCAAYNPNELPTPDFPAACARTGPWPLWRCPDGKWTDLAATCGAAPFDYNGVPLWLTAEFPTGTVSGTVSVRSIRYLADSCKCGAQDECWSPSGGLACAPAQTSASFCPASDRRCAGVCSDARPSAAL